MLFKLHVSNKEIFTMPTLLQLDSSPLESSISRELTREFVKTWKAKHTDGTVIDRDLVAHPAKPLDAQSIGAIYTPAAARTPQASSSEWMFFGLPLCTMPPVAATR